MLNNMAAQYNKTQDATQGYSLDTYKLDNIRRVADMLGNPQDKISNVIYITGTNGKGSTLTFLKSIFLKASLRCNTYTSPHIVSRRERIFLANQYISDEYLDHLLEKIRHYETQALVGSSMQDRSFLSWFERYTLAAYLGFAETDADFNLIEVGIGARLDATNIISQVQCAVITSISMDHANYLGDSIENIAYEKSFVIKPNCACFLGQQDYPQVANIIKAKSTQMGSELHAYSIDFDLYCDICQDNMSQCNCKPCNYWSLISANGEVIIKGLPNPSLLGKHQFYNAALAVRVAKYLQQEHPQITDEAINLGIKNAYWPGRLEQIKTDAWNFIMDGAHNIAGAKALANWIRGQHILKPLCFVLAMKRDKACNEFVQILINCQLAHSRNDSNTSSLNASMLFICTTLEIEGLDFYSSNEMREVISQLANSNSAIKNSIKVEISALEDIMMRIKQYQDSHHVICTGSLFLIGHIHKYLAENNT